MKWASLAFAAVLFLSASAASAATIDLDSWAFNVDGTTYQSQLGDVLPASFNTAGFNFTTGLGVMSIHVTGAGGHSVDSFFDLEIDQLVNGFSNEYGATGNAPAAGQSWEIDEPGYVFGNIYNHVLTDALDNTNAILSTDPDDVSLALGWDFVLAADQEAFVTFRIGMAEPPAFYLSQTDPNSAATVFFDSPLSIRQLGPNVIPEPITMVGCLLGLGAVTRYARKRRA